MIQKNPTSRAEQEREDCGHAVYKNWCAVCVERRCVEKQLQVEPLEEDGRERTKPSLVAFDHVSLTQGNCRHIPNSNLSRPCLRSNGS